MKTTDPELAPALSCWMDIGIWGDKTCPELPGVGHCRNCKVYSTGGRQLFDRQSPDNYVDIWTELVARDKEAEATETTPYVVFRLGQSWLAIRATVLRELTQPVVIRSIPHQRTQILLGLAAVRGEIMPCLSLHALMGEPSPQKAGATARFFVARHQGADWIFPVDEVSGIYDIQAGAIEPLPATLTHADSFYTMGIAHCGDRPAALVDEELVFGAISREMA